MPISRRTVALALAAMVVVAALGYLAGRKGSNAGRESADPESTESATGPSFRVEFPAAWRSSSGSARTPDIGIVGQLLLVPRAAGTQVGLLVGVMGAGQEGPLPTHLRGLLDGLPRVQVVDLQATQAFSYRDVRMSGYRGTLELYLIPNRGQRPLLLVCYAASGLASYLPACDQIAATVEPTGAAEYDLTPDGAYARQLSALVNALNAQRAPLRQAIRTESSADAPLAEELAGRFQAADASLTLLKAPPAAASAQGTLAAAMGAAASAYRALAAGSVAHAAAVAGIERSERAVNSALEGFALIGYGEA